MGWEGDELRAWVVGCSTGEEAYSVAMIMAEAAVPENGKANKELIKTLSQVLGVPASRLAIVSGATSRHKVVEVDGADPLSHLPSKPDA